MKAKIVNKKSKVEKGWFTIEEMFDSIHQLSRTLKTSQTSRGVVESSRKAWESKCGHAA